MEAKLRGKAHELYVPVVSDLNMKAVGKKSLEWDLNDWKWDGDLFVARELNSLPSSDCRNRQNSPEITNQDLPNSLSSSSTKMNPESEKKKRELEKRRREELNAENGSINLNLGEKFNLNFEAEAEKWEDKSEKKAKLVGTSSKGAVCQVDDCGADLSTAKDYHRRHKVCHVHSKANMAMVGKVMERFCQQCSRFHALQEFDEGKRSCRRRLAGHNRRRRKTHPDSLVNGTSLKDEKGSSYLLISLLRILSNMQSSGSDETKNQDLLSHLLRNLANNTGTVNGANLSGLLQGSQDKLTTATNVEIQGNTSNLISNCTEVHEPCRATRQCIIDHESEILHGRINLNNAQESTTGRAKLNNIDLNNIYNEPQVDLENLESFHPPVNPNAGSVSFPLWIQKELQKFDLPQTGGNLASTSARSLSSSSSSSSKDAQFRTGRIVFKLFGKDPNDCPVQLRPQILSWLSHSPTDIESYIRPGCIVLTIYLRMGNATWEELCCNLGSSLIRLLDTSNDSFWTRGWVYTRVRDHLAFIYNGQIVMDTPLPLKSRKNCVVSSISPIAVPLSERVQFVVRGYNISRSTTRLLCALEGKYLFQETCYNLVYGTETFIELEDLQCLSFTCAIPNFTGRGFIEVEDDDLSSSFLPFIVAEQDVCAEICTLEGVIEASETEKMEVKNQAINFIHEMGWLLHKNQLKLRIGDADPNLNVYHFTRMKLLLEFAMDRDWCAVVNKLLGIMFNGSVDGGDHSFEHALTELYLLHKAVQRKCRPMVELLLRYNPAKNVSDSNAGPTRLLFRPDAVGPAGLTPLHIVASTSDSANLLDALTSDPGSVGLDAWKNALDSTGLSPYDYACLQGHYPYVLLVQKKINQKSENGHVVVDIPSLQIEKLKAGVKVQGGSCKICERKHGCGRNGTLMTYRPAMLSMVAIAAVCVCVALLFKSSPEVLYVFRPFRWEMLKYGSS